MQATPVGVVPSKTSSIPIVVGGFGGSYFIIDKGVDGEVEVAPGVRKSPEI